ncbi:hypothetical protein ILYODFUR_033897 [Ilyodon furcidens]|uniref:Uncharacterized protein n=1 Tax=Ilyodon furcidens TaxID=33524 RepID=A0ABV0TS07_9TELE
MISFAADFRPLNQIPASTLCLFYGGCVILQIIAYTHIILRYTPAVSQTVYDGAQQTSIQSAVECRFYSLKLATPSHIALLWIVGNGRIFRHPVQAQKNKTIYYGLLKVHVSAAVCI